jgi:hypothetical protein
MRISRSGRKSWSSAKGDRKSRPSLDKQAGRSVRRAPQMLFAPPLRRSQEGKPLPSACVAQIVHSRSFCQPPLFAPIPVADSIKTTSRMPRTRLSVVSTSSEGTPICGLNGECSRPHDYTHSSATASSLSAISSDVPGVPTSTSHKRSISGRSLDVLALRVV